MKSGDFSHSPETGLLAPRAVEVIAALLMALYVIAVLASIYTRLAVTDDVVITSRVVGDNGGNTSFSKRGTDPVWDLAPHATNIVSGFLLVAAAAFLYRVYRGHEPALALAGSLMFLGAACFAAMAGVIGWVLAQEYQSPLGYVGVLEDKGILTSRDGLFLLESFLEPARALTGKVGFTFAALAIVAYGGLIAWSGAAPRWLGWLGVVAGLLMFFIWVETDTAIGLFFTWVKVAEALHRIGGGLYLVCLALLAGWLLIRGTSETWLFQRRAGIRGTSNV